MGMIIIPITIPADKALKVVISGKMVFRKGVTIVNAKKPYTTVGTAAKTSNNGLNTFLKDLGAYSLRYMAIVNPRGKATNMAIVVVRMVPLSNGRMPYDFLVNNGVHSVDVRNSIRETSAKKIKDWLKRT